MGYEYKLGLGLGLGFWWYAGVYVARVSGYVVEYEGVSVGVSVVWGVENEGLYKGLYEGWYVGPVNLYSSEPGVGEVGTKGGDDGDEGYVGDVGAKGGDVEYW